MNIKLSTPSNGTLPEGHYEFKVVDVRDEFDGDRITVQMETSDGRRFDERFNLKYRDGNVNMKALKALSYFARTVLDDSNLIDLDTNAMVGHYIEGDILHKPYTNFEGEEKVAVNLTNYHHIDGFSTNVIDMPADDLEALFNE